MIAVVLLAACESKSKSGPKPNPAPLRHAVEPGANFAIVSEEIAFPFGAVTLHGTITRPVYASAPRPGVLLLAGSGPTDRDWTSALLEGTNGSGKQLAEALARHGVVTLRFDKSGAGVNPGPPPEQVTFDLYRDEGLAALTALRARPDVDPAHVFVAGNSEGGVHATRIAIAARGQVAGVVYLASASRSMQDTMLGQIAANLRDNAKLPEPDTQRRIGEMKAILDAFVAGKPVDLTAMSQDIPQLVQVIASLTAPNTAGLMRTYLSFDNAAEAAAVDVPVLICQGGKDVQIDPELDARRLEASLKAAGRDVTLHLSPDANHVFKHEPKTLAQLRADVGSAAAAYTAAGVVLEPDFVDALVAWLAAHTER